MVTQRPETCCLHCEPCNHSFYPFVRATVLLRGENDQKSVSEEARSPPTGNDNWLPASPPLPSPIVSALLLALTPCQRWTAVSTSLTLVVSKCTGQVRAGLPEGCQVSPSHLRPGLPTSHTRHQSSLSCVIVGAPVSLSHRVGSPLSVLVPLLLDKIRDVSGALRWDKTCPQVCQSVSPAIHFFFHS